MLGFRRKRGERCIDGLPEPRQQLNQNVERLVLLKLEQGRAWLAQLEPERVPVGVVGEQADGAGAVPERECGGLVLGFAVRVLQLQHDPRRVWAGGSQRERRGCVRERVADP